MELGAFPDLRYFLRHGDDRQTQNDLYAVCQCISAISPTFMPLNMITEQST